MREINGDNIAGIKNKLFYLIFNFVRGIAGHLSFVHSSYWHPQSVRDGDDSPARKYLDSFLEMKIPELFPERQLKVLDIGCGSGYIRDILSRLGYTVDYTGVDIVKEDDFEKHEHENITSNLVLSSIEEFHTNERFDLVFSMCALEHVKDDSAAIVKSERYTKQGGYQIHIVPSYWALFVYLWHGYRQYTPVRLNHLFGATKPSFYRLGGLFSGKLSFWSVTVFTYLLKMPQVRNTSIYNLLNRKANILDRYIPFFPLMYVIVVKD
jgi:SAM-dependent methyltransferase